MLAILTLTKASLALGSGDPLPFRGSRFHLNVQHEDTISTKPSIQKNAEKGYASSTYQDVHSFHKVENYKE